MTRDRWDQPTERDAVRVNFRKVCKCRTPALGGEVYASATEQKICYHTCKSKCCPSCGNRGTQLWQREQWAALPDIPFVGIVLTMPDHFWPVFQDHRHLRHDLPALGAAVVQHWAWSRYRVRLYAVVIQHTFGGRLNHHPHLHVMVSAGGLNQSNTSWVETLEFDRTEIMKLWRFGVTSYLWKANRGGLLRPSSIPNDFNDLVLKQTQRRWNIHITRRMTKRHFLGYAGRYIRRLPLSQKRLLRVTDREVVYQSKDTRTQSVLETRCTPAEFVALLSQHVPATGTRCATLACWRRGLSERLRRLSFSCSGRNSDLVRRGWDGGTPCSATSRRIPFAIARATRCIGSGPSGRARSDPSALVYLSTNLNPLRHDPLRPPGRGFTVLPPLPKITFCFS